MVLGKDDQRKAMCVCSGHDGIQLALLRCEEQREFHNLSSHKPTCKSAKFVLNLTAIY